MCKVCKFLKKFKKDRLTFKEGRLWVSEVRQWVREIRLNLKGRR